jgi:hypothetical protein
MTKQEVRNSLIAEDETHFGRPLTAGELAAIDADINRACGGQWIDWCAYQVKRMVGHIEFNSRAEATEFWTEETRVNKERGVELARRDALMDKACANARR